MASILFCIRATTKTLLYMTISCHFYAVSAEANRIGRKLFLWFISEVLFQAQFEESASGLGHYPLCGQT